MPVSTPMIELSKQRVSIIQIIVAAADSLFQGTMMLITRYQEKFYIKGRQMALLFFFLAKIAGNIVIIVFNALIFNSHVTYEYYRQILALNSIYQYLFYKSVPSALFVIISSMSIGLLVGVRVQKIIKILSIAMISALVVLQSISLILSTIQTLRASSDATAGDVYKLLTGFDITFTLMVVVTYCIFNALAFRKRRDKLLLDCLQQVKESVQYEMTVFLYYCVVSAVYQLIRSRIAVDIQNYECYVILDVFFDIFFNVVYGLTFLAPTRFEHRQRKQQIEMLSQPANVLDDNFPESNARAEQHASESDLSNDISF